MQISDQSSSMALQVSNEESAAVAVAAITVDDAVGISYSGISRVVSFVRTALRSLTKTPSGVTGDLSRDPANS